MLSFVFKNSYKFHNYQNISVIRYSSSPISYNPSKNFSNSSNNPSNPKVPSDNSLIRLGWLHSLKNNFKQIFSLSINEVPSNWQDRKNKEQMKFEFLQKMSLIGKPTISDKTFSTHTIYNYNGVDLMKTERQIKLMGLCAIFLTSISLPTSLESLARMNWIFIAYELNKLFLQRRTVIQITLLLNNNVRLQFINGMTSLVSIKDIKFIEMINLRDLHEEYGKMDSIIIFSVKNLLYQLKINSDYTKIENIELFKYILYSQPNEISKFTFIKNKDHLKPSHYSSLSSSISSSNIQNFISAWRIQKDVIKAFKPLEIDYHYTNKHIFICKNRNFISVRFNKYMEYFWISLISSGIFFPSVISYAAIYFTLDNSRKLLDIMRFERNIVQSIEILDNDKVRINFFSRQFIESSIVDIKYISTSHTSQEFDTAISNDENNNYEIIWLEVGVNKKRCFIFVDHMRTRIENIDLLLSVINGDNNLAAKFLYKPKNTKVDDEFMDE